MQLLINALIGGSFAALLAGGLTLVYGVLRVFNISHGQLALVGGYTTWWLHQVAHVPLVPSILGGVLTAAFVTWICFEVAIAPFYRRHPFLPLVSTIAFSIILDAFFPLLFGESTKSIVNSSGGTMAIGDALITYHQLILIAFTLVLLACTGLILFATPFGRRVRASVQQPEAARSLGIASGRLHRIVFISSGVLAGLAGIYMGIDQNISPAFSFPLTIRAYAAVIAGGKDNLWGTVLAAYIISLLEQMAVGLPWWFGSYIPAGYQGSVALVVVMVVLLFLPNGLFTPRSRTA